MFDTRVEQASLASWLISFKVMQELRIVGTWTGSKKPRPPRRLPCRCFRNRWCKVAEYSLFSEPTRVSTAADWRGVNIWSVITDTTDAPMQRQRRERRSCKHRLARS